MLRISDSRSRYAQTQLDDQTSQVSEQQFQQCTGFIAEQLRGKWVFLTWAGTRVRVVIFRRRDLSHLSWYTIDRDRFRSVVSDGERISPRF